MKIGTKVLLQFLERFDENPFIVKIDGEEFRMIALHQVLFTKGINNGIPMVRWY